MKKILLYSMLALGTGLFSCSQEDLMEQGDAPQAGQPVTVAVQLPGKLGTDAASRALPSIPEGHMLRCILYVSGEGETEIRRETVVADASGTISFTFTPVTDTYTCSFWADYITDTEAADGKYDDLYYNTQELPNVTYSSSLAEGCYNNDACDAFTGCFSAEELTTSGTVILKRPFAKVNFVEKDSEVSGTISVTGYDINNGMNITDGTISSATITLPSYNGTVADGTNKIWFYNYLFADGENTKLPASISMTVGSGTATTISTDELVLNANTQYNLSLTANVGEVVPSPKVGDYFYTDGTWSTDYNGEKTIAGVVFAVKGDGTNSAIESDVVANYSDISGASDVLAWVLAAKDASTSANVGFYVGSEFSLPNGIGTGTDDIKGYSNTALWLVSSATDYNAASTAKSYNVTIEAVDVVTSGWYLPSIGQMKALSTVYDEKGADNAIVSLVVKQKLQALSEVEPEAGTTMGGNYWTSTGGTNDESPSASGAYRIAFPADGTSGGNALRTGDNLDDGSRIRSVLTILK